MELKQLSEHFFVSPQITAADVDVLKADGFDAVMCNRPDGEDAGQPSSSDIEALCRAQGIDFLWVPMNGPNIPMGGVEQAAEFIAGHKKVLGYCRSGNRSGIMFQAVQSA